MLQSELLHTVVQLSRDLFSESTQPKNCACCTILHPLGNDASMLHISSQVMGLPLNVNKPFLQFPRVPRG